MAFFLSPNPRACNAKMSAIVPEDVVATREPRYSPARRSKAVTYFPKFVIWPLASISRNGASRRSRPGRSALISGTAVIEPPLRFTCIDDRGMADVVPKEYRLFTHARSTNVNGARLARTIGSARQQRERRRRLNMQRQEN